MQDSAKIPLTTKVFYGAGSIATGVKETAFNVFLLFFYTQVAGLPGGLAGTAIFIALLIDAISDPLVGYWSDRLKTRWGRRHPLMYAAAIPMGFAFYLLFHPPIGAGETQVFAWMLTFAVLVRFAMTFYQVPSTALTAEMTSDYDERTSLSGFRVLMGWLGGIGFAILAYIVFLAPTADYADGRLNPQGYEALSLTGAIMIVVTILLCSLGTHGLIPRLKAISESGAASTGLLSDFSNMLRNPPFLVLVAIIFICASGIGFAEVTNLYMFTYFWGLSTEEIALVTFAALIGTVVAFVTVPIASRRYDKRPVGMIGVFILMLANPSLIGLRLLGVLPENGTPELLGLVCLIAGIAVFGGVGLTIIFTSMLADTMDRNELETGQRQEAAYSSALTFSLKATSGFGGLVAGFVLQAVDFPPGAEAAEIAPETLSSLGASVAGVIVVFWLFAFLAFRMYSLSRSEHAAILEQINAKRALTTA